MSVENDELPALVGVARDYARCPGPGSRCCYSYSSYHHPVHTHPHTMCTKLYTRSRPCPCPTPCAHPLGTLIACHAWLSTGRCPGSRAVWTGEYTDEPCVRLRLRAKWENQREEEEMVEMWRAEKEREGEEGGQEADVVRGPEVVELDLGGSDKSVEVGEGDDEFGGYSPHASDESIGGDEGEGEGEDGVGGEVKTTGADQDQRVDTNGEGRAGGASGEKSGGQRKTFVDYYYDHVE
ncbi:hypothetical protein P171DRAFT_494804 [Karstenula rhodostoma CBS 690.94]|uniref:Uncharacterized protein n=1 Tax=Karstenula rhodostoma CBS 690.94 TaxID=1392251 RepID=A0A9P4UAG3_9PLEO|nr:hypothetical protein P171DRAFT_494804 [Karstenula rhodostoma CBS 690.94]